MPEPEKSPSLKPKKPIQIFVARFLGLMLLLVAILFLPAARLDWWQAWAFVIAYAVFIVAFLVREIRKDPGQLQERSQTAENVKSWDKVILAIYTLLLLAMLILSGLDAGRYFLLPLSPVEQWLGWMLGVLSGALIWWTSSVNTYLSRHVRIQQERGHHAVTRGPYRWIRHPMYASLIIFIFCVPMMLGSGMALIPACLIAVLMVIRTALEDKTLFAELPGYKEYVKIVKYRLLPGIW